MLIQYFHHFALFIVFMFYIDKSTLSMIFRDKSIRRFERGIATKYLIFPQGSNVQLVYCLTLGTYTKPQGNFTVGATAGLAWELPYKNTVPYREPAEVYHRRSRRELYRKVELMLKAQGKDGKACVLKAICKAAERKHEDLGNGTLVEEILHAIFTLSKGWFNIDPMTEYERTYHLSENCGVMQAKCPDVF